MKALCFAFFCLISLPLYAGNALDELMDAPGAVGDQLRLQALYPPLVLELPAETEARRALLVMRDKAKAAGTLTPELELAINKAVAEILTAEAARIQRDREARQPVHVVIDN